MLVTQTTTLCPGVYEINDAGDPGVLNVSADGATLDCGGAKLIGDGAGIGILSSATSHVTITNCYVQGYATGIAVNDVQHGTLFQTALFSNTVGMQLDEVTAMRITQNYAWGNGSGIHLAGASDTEISQNLVCTNRDVDIQSSGGTGNSGSENVCDQAQGWSDAGGAGCTFTCAPLRHIYLPVVLRNH
jgi:hypothetical protein